MEGGPLTNKAGMLLKDRGIEQAVWVIAIVKPQPQAENPNEKVGEKVAREGRTNQLGYIESMT